MAISIWGFLLSLKYLTRWSIERAHFIAMAVAIAIAMMVLCDSLLAVSWFFSPKNLMKVKLLLCLLLYLIEERGI